MKKRTRSALVVMLVISGFSMNVHAFDEGRRGSDLFGNPNTYGLTKEDLRKDRPGKASWGFQEATEAGRLETEGDESSSRIVEFGGLLYSSIDLGP